MIYLAFLVAFVAIGRLIYVFLRGFRTAPDVTYYLCRPFGFPMSMMWGFLGWLLLFAVAGWAISFIVNYFIA